MTKSYVRPICSVRDDLGPDAMCLAGGWMWFDKVEICTRSSRKIVPVNDVPENLLVPLVRSRDALGGISAERPNIMGILNVTPDSFSDGGLHSDLVAAKSKAKELVADGADILDIGGESTRPGSDYVSVEDEISRTIPLISEIAQHDLAPISLDTRKSKVAEAGRQAGAVWLNDVSALNFDRGMVDEARHFAGAVCLMHAQGNPDTMQSNPMYDDVVFDIYDYLEDRISFAVSNGVQREKIIVDPGIGFGKNLNHNLALLKNLSIFHGLGCVVLLGASRKRFIGTVTDEPDALKRVSGSVSVAVEAARQGIQIIRVHDVKETQQGLKMAQALWS